ncbi:MAG: HPr family phosphocarrier protein [bacterium]
MKSLKEKILDLSSPSYSRFLEVIQEYAQGLLSQCLISKGEDPEGKISNRIFLSRLVANARLLEDFLDDHGAQRNEKWFYFRELVATARGFGQTGYLILFIKKRYPTDSLELQDFKEFFQGMVQVQDFLVKAILYIFKKLLIQANKLGIRVPETPFDMPGEDDSLGNARLPVTMHKTRYGDEEKDIAKVCSLYQNLAQNFDPVACHTDYKNFQKLKQIVPDVINEECIRKFELEMHNLESVYDTYVKYKSREDKDPRLAHLRNYISIPLLLLEAARAWAHFYERHPKIHEEIHHEVNLGCILDYILNWALFYCRKFVAYGKNLADELLHDYTSKGSIELGIPRNLGFHLRPATLVAKIVNHYGSEVFMIVGEDKFDAGSILSITWAGGKIARDNIQTVTFTGDKRALKDLEILAGVNYGEDTMGKDIPLPKELSYLR